MTLFSSLETIEKWLLVQGVAVDELPPPVNQQDWGRVERLFSTGIPDDLKNLYARHDGLPEWLYLFNTWNLISAEEVVKVSKLYGDVFTSGKSQESWKGFWFPFMSDGAGDYLFVNLKNEKIYKFTHEGGYTTFISDDISKLFATMAEDFETGTYTFDDYEVNYMGKKLIE